MTVCVFFPKMWNVPVKVTEQNKGIITARPSISITVVRDENRLVDNNNGDTYY